MGTWSTHHGWRPSCVSITLITAIITTHRSFDEATNICLGQLTRVRISHDVAFRNEAVVVYINFTEAPPRLALQFAFCCTAKCTSSSSGCRASFARRWRRTSRRCRAWLWCCCIAATPLRCRTNHITMSSSPADCSMSSLTELIRARWRTAASDAARSTSCSSSSHHHRYGSSRSRISRFKLAFPGCFPGMRTFPLPLPPCEADLLHREATSSSSCFTCHHSVLADPAKPSRSIPTV